MYVELGGHHCLRLCVCARVCVSAQYISTLRKRQASTMCQNTVRARAICTSRTPDKRRHRTQIGYFSLGLPPGGGPCALRRHGHPVPALSGRLALSLALSHLALSSAEFGLPFSHDKTVKAHESQKSCLWPLEPAGKKNTH